MADAGTQIMEKPNYTLGDQDMERWKERDRQFSFIFRFRLNSEILKTIWYNMGLTIRSMLCNNTLLMVCYLTKYSRDFMPKPPPPLPLDGRNLSQYYIQARRYTTFGCHPWCWVGGGSNTDRNRTVYSVPYIVVLQDPDRDNKYKMVKLKSIERKEKNKTDKK